VSLNIVQIGCENLEWEQGNRLFCNLLRIFSHPHYHDLFVTPLEFVTAFAVCILLIDHLLLILKNLGEFSAVSTRVLCLLGTQKKKSMKFA